MVKQLLMALFEVLGYTQTLSSSSIKSSETVARVLLSDCSEATQRLSMILQTDLRKCSLTCILPTMSLRISRKLA